MAGIMKLSKYIIVAVLAMAAGTLTAFSQESDRKDVRRGNRQFRDGNYKEAVVDYQKALLRDSSSFAASYNLANALYRMENFNEARAVLDTVAQAAPQSGYASDYYYNTGNTAVSLQDYEAAVNAYREALLRNPGDLDAKENYIYARKKLEDQNRQENQDNQDNKDDQNNQDNQDNQGGGDDNQDQNDRNQDNKDNGGNEGDNGHDNQDDGQGDNRQQPQSGQSPQSRPQISKQAAQQMLNAIMAKEKETQDKVKKEKAAVLKSKQREKNW